MDNYIYLIIEREFINSRQNIFKVGKSKQENCKRIVSYPKGSKLLYCRLCKNCDITEIIILNIFKTKYDSKKDIGNEYFEGNPYNMINDINDVINKELNPELETQNNLFFDKTLYDTNNFEEFIKSDHVVLGENLYCRQIDLYNCYMDFCHEIQYEKCKFSEKLYCETFKKYNIDIRYEELKYPSNENKICGYMFVFGIGIKERLTYSDSD